MKTRAAALVLLVASAAGVARLQPRLAATAHQIKEGADVYALPPPAQLHTATLGWEAAAVDQLWAQLLVAYGTHWSEHRDFTDTPSYADAILELEPTYAPLYRHIGTMLAYRPLQGTDADVRRARAYLERGTRERPDDADLWIEYGEFIAFMAPSFLHDQAESGRWRKDGAEAIGHAVELGAEAERALTAATVLGKAGATQEAVRYLERAYAFTEHPSMSAIHEAIGRRLAELEDTELLEAADAAARAVDDRWQREMPFVSRDRYLLLGPVVDPARCAGLPGADDAACAHAWGSRTLEESEPTRERGSRQ
jgi:hypothetical protein